MCEMFSLVMGSDNVSSCPTDHCEDRESAWCQASASEQEVKASDVCLDENAFRGMLSRRANENAMHTFVLSPTSPDAVPY